MKKDLCEQAVYIMVGSGKQALQNTTIKRLREDRFKTWSRKKRGNTPETQ